MPCVFCQILSGEIPSEILYQDKKVFAIRDIHPLAPVHILIMPKEHIPSLAQLGAEQAPLIGQMVRVANRLAEREGVLQKGYRLVINSGREGGQAVPHLHLHLLGGRQLADELG